jgi:uncharacterized protein (TIGR00369 family)
MSSEQASGSGMDQLRAWLSTGNEPPIATTLGFKLIEIDDGRAVFAGTPDASHLNPMGGVHGGYGATLLDSACGIAVVSLLEPNCSFTTLELKVSYLRGMNPETGPVRAEGRVIQMGRRAAFAEASIMDAQGRTLATATSTALIISK